MIATTIDPMTMKMIQAREIGTQVAQETGNCDAERAPAILRCLIAWHGILGDIESAIERTKQDTNGGPAAWKIALDLMGC